MPFRLTADAAEQLLIHGFVADNGTGDALMEQCCVQQNVPVTLLGFRLSPVDVHHIGQQLEGIEGNADGQDDFLNKLRNFSKDAADQTGIFEIADEGDFNHHCRRKPEFFSSGIRLFQLQGAQPGNKGHKHQQQDILGFTPGVEYQREGKQHHILALLGSAEAVDK